MKNTFYLNISTADSLGIGLFKYSISPQERFIITNYALVKLLGFKYKKELHQTQLGQYFLSPEEKERFFRVLRQEGRVRFFETQFRNTQGKHVWVAVTASLVISKNKHEYIEGIIENISSHKDMEEKLAYERDFLQGLLDNIPDAIYFKDCDHRIIKVNKFYAQGVGLGSTETAGKTDFDFFPYEQAKRMYEDDKYVLTKGKPIVGKVERTTLPNGTWNQVITTKIPMYDRKGKIIGTMGITRDMTAYAHLESERRTMLINALKVLGKALEMRDPYTFSHTRHVADIAEAIGQRLNWDENRLLEIRLAAELHDLGKIGVPLDILNKPGTLTPLEYNLIQEHVTMCYDLIKDIVFPFPLAEIIYQHHEHLDGTGYPRKLKGDQLCLESRILAVSDALEAMTHRRPYREGLGIDRALHELRTASGSKYDPQIVDIVNQLVEENHGRVFWAGIS
ncbi:MAG: PAS domain S-box protein [Candidatus Omnitrophica bacterium]|nr:PAS domain S-box protein [Candidatus Omnitrophota bacterium]